jgi:endonuclease I
LCGSKGKEQEMIFNGNTGRLMPGQEQSVAAAPQRPLKVAMAYVTDFHCNDQNAPKIERYVVELLSKGYRYPHNWHWHSNKVTKKPLAWFDCHSRKLKGFSCRPNAGI